MFVIGDARTVLGVDSALSWYLAHSTAMDHQQKDTAIRSIDLE